MHKMFFQSPGGFGAVMPIEAPPPIEVLPADLTPTPTAPAEGSESNPAQALVKLLLDAEGDDDNKRSLIEQALELGERVAEFLTKAAAERAARLGTQLEVLQEQCRTQRTKVGKAQEEVGRRITWLNTTIASANQALLELKAAIANLPDPDHWPTREQIAGGNERVEEAREKARTADHEKGEAFQHYNQGVAELQTERAKLIELAQTEKRVRSGAEGKPFRDPTTGLSEIPRA